MARCIRRGEVAELPGATAGVEFTFTPDDIDVTIRCVDNTGAPVAFTVARSVMPSLTFHFVAGEAWTRERLALEEDEVWMIVSAANSTIEVIRNQA